ncbi:MAG: amidohydrolase family protein, partial [Acidimicrobiia bacterium]|nr:amidohydrolase family protein [Acidimicrobiia bacterium]
MGKAQTVIRAKALLDGTGAPPVPNAVVVVEGSRILAAGPEEAVAAPRGPDVRELDYPDAYLLPGLIDAHTHLMFGAGEATYEEVIERDTDEIMLLRAARNAHIHLNAGVTTLRDCGARNQVTFDLRRGVDQGLSLAPRLLLSGRPVTVTGGHFWWCNGEADGVQGVRKAVRRLVEDGADFIKIMASGGGTAGTDNRRPSFSVEELRAIVDEAHNQGVPTTAHCIATQSIANALDAGVDSIEHATFIEPDGSYRFNPHIAERIADQGVRVSPTVQTGYRRREKLLAMREEGHALTPMDKSRLEDLQIKCERQVEFLGRLWSEWGITIVAGTDAISS